ncbi:glycosyltransferase family protein [Bacillus rhizoplanae]|uniref:glycosyltransferase family protein n=1 Tax=Bacillus rhizoplanae TaxID=2880966 RepID=UPI003D24911D
MRILFLESSQIWTAGLPKGFVDAGHKVMISGPLTQKNIPHMIESFQPDLVITIGWGVEHTDKKLKWIKKYLHEARTPLVYWAVEDPQFTTTWSLPLINKIQPSFVFTISPATVDYYKQQGIKAAYMDFGHHSSVHFPVDTIPQYQASIAVVANAYPDVLEKYPQHFRHHAINTLIRPLLAENIRIDFWGRHWDKMNPFLGMDIPKDWIHGYAPYNEANYIYSSTNIVLGLQNYPSQVTQRTYEILASGGFLLTMDTPGVRHLFQPGHDLVVSSSPEETVKLVKYFLEHPASCEKIREQGKLTVKIHNYQHRAEFMVNVLTKEGIIKPEIIDSKEQGEIYYYENFTEEKYQLYIVSPSDSLWSISQKFGVTISDLKNLNSLANDEIFVDQVLKVREIIDTTPFLVQSENKGTLGNPLATQWIKPIFQAAKKHNIPCNILYSIMIAESNGNPNLVSKTGGIGLMQFQIETANLLGINPCNAFEAIYGAARYLQELYTEFKDWKLAIAAYNAGPDMVKKYGGIPPLEEPQNYVKKVLSYSKAVSFDNL